MVAVLPTSNCLVVLFYVYLLMVLPSVLISDRIRLPPPLTVCNSRLMALSRSGEMLGVASKLRITLTVQCDVNLLFKRLKRNKGDGGSKFIKKNYVIWNVCPPTLRAPFRT